MERKTAKKLFLIPIYMLVLLAIYFIIVYATPSSFVTDDLSIFGIVAFITCIATTIFCIVISKVSDNNERKLVDVVKNGEYQFMQTNITPLAFCERSGNIVWANDAFRNISGGHYDIGKNICGLFTEITKQSLHDIDTDPIIVMSSHEGKVYQVKLICVNKNDYDDIKELKEEESNKDNDVKKSDYVMAICYDETEIEAAKLALDNNKLAIGLINLDNYDEVSEALDEFKISVLRSFVERKLSRFASENSGVIKRLEKDKFMMLLDKSHINSITENKSYSQIVDEIRNETAGTDSSFTLSIGLGISGRTIEETYDFAKTALNLALGRGGDQIVIKDGKDVSFHGGKEGTKEKTKRVRARIKAWSFKEILDIKERVFIMGHANADVDSFGSALGIYLMALSMDKEAYIVLNPDSLTAPVVELMKLYNGTGQYSEKMFISGKNALDLFNKKSMLVVVDHNNEKISQEPKLIEEADTIAIFDHHRVGVNSIQGAVISYIEPNASSTCEMIAEMLEYFDDNIKLKKLEAETLLAGIVVDTNNFTSQTGARTFDVAAFLKQNGAEVSFVRKLLRENFDEIKLVSEAISNAEIFNNDYIIASFDSSLSSQPLVTIALIANDLIETRGIKASFALTKIEDKVHISARSIDEVNVQVIMEKLGGGGHHSSAATQIENVTIEEAVEKLKGVLSDPDLM